MSAQLAAISGKLDLLDGKLQSTHKGVAELAAGVFTGEAAWEAFKKAGELALDFLKDITIEGAAVADVEENFNTLTAGAGRLGETLLGELKAGTHNTITDFELMKMVNADLAAGLNLTDKQFRIAADAAFALAQATGGDVATSLETVNDALRTGRTRSIQMLTGQIDLEAAQVKYAESVHKTVDQLTEAENKQVKQEAILNALSGATKRLGEQTDGLDELIAQAATAWANFKEELGAKIATSPVLIGLLKDIESGIKAAFGGDQKKLITQIAESVDQALVRVTDFGSITAQVADIAYRAWSAVWSIINLAAEGIVGLTHHIYNIGIALTQVGAKMHLISPEEVERVQAVGKFLGDLTDDIDKNQQAAHDAAEGNSAFTKKMDELSAALDKARDRAIMNAKAHKDAMEATDGHAEAAKKAAPPVADLGKAAAKTAADLKAEQEALLAVTQAEIDQDEALASLAFQGGAWRDVLGGMNAETVAHVRQAVLVGASQQDIAKAFNLTEYQVRAVTMALTDQQKAYAELFEATLQQEDAMAEIAFTGGKWRDVLAGIDEQTQKQVRDSLAMGESTATVAEAYGLTEFQVRAVARAMDETNRRFQLANDYLTLMSDSMNLFGNASDSALGKALRIASQVLKIIGDITAIARAGAKEGGGGGKGGSIWGSILSVGLSIAPFFLAEGGVGDFGSGAPAMLHGKEAVIPLDRWGEMVSESSNGGHGEHYENNFYINGTGAEIARQVDQTLMRRYKQTRQVSLS